MCAFLDPEALSTVGIAPPGAVQTSFLREVLGRTCDFLVQWTGNSCFLSREGAGILTFSAIGFDSGVKSVEIFWRPLM